MDLPLRLSVGDQRATCRHRLSIWLVLLIARRFTALVGVLIGLPTLRLRGDYLAIVTLGFGEIVPQVVRNADNSSGLQPHERPARDHPDRLARLRPPRQRRLACPRATSSRRTGRDSSTGRRSRCSLFTVFCSRPAARLAARPRLGRDPRGRDRRRRDGHAADADEDLGLRDRRVLRRRRRRVFASYKSGAVPERLLLKSRSSSSAW